jgi:hypothetical protein
MDYILTSNGELYHHGIKGMKWGIRRYQNKDGSLTPAGEKRLQKYKDQELDLVTKKYKVEKLASRRDKLEDEFLDKYDTYTQSRLNKARYQHLKAQSMEYLEKQKILDMTYDDMRKERAEIRNARAEKFVHGLGRTVVGKLIGESSGGLRIDKDAFKTNLRVGVDESIYVDYEARKNSGYSGL